MNRHARRAFKAQQKGRGDGAERARGAVEQEQLEVVREAAHAFTTTAGAPTFDACSYLIVGAYDEERGAPRTVDGRRLKGIVRMSRVLLAPFMAKILAHEQAIGIAPTLSDALDNMVKAAPSSAIRLLYISAGFAFHVEAIARVAKHGPVAPLSPSPWDDILPLDETEAGRFINARGGLA